MISIHDAANFELLERFKSKKIIWDIIDRSDIINNSFLSNLSLSDRSALDFVLQDATYGQYYSTDLSQFVRSEVPWLEARQGLSPSEKCEKEIDENLMKNYYSELKYIFNL